MCMKVQVHSCIKPLPEHNLRTNVLEHLNTIVTFLNILGIKNMLSSFKIFLEDEVCKELTGSFI